MSLRIIEEKAKVTTAEAGMNGYDAEVTVEVWEDNHRKGVYYVHANCFEVVGYTVSEKSMYDWLTNKTNEDPGEIDFLEQYEEIEDAEESPFYAAIQVADRMLDDLINAL